MNKEMKANTLGNMRTSRGRFFIKLTTGQAIIKITSIHMTALTRLDTFLKSTTSFMQGTILPELQRSPGMRPRPLGDIRKLCHAKIANF